MRARSCWNWGRSAGLVAENKTWPMRLMLSEPAGRTRHLSDEELKTLLNEGEKHSPLDVCRNCFVGRLRSEEGELLRLAWSDLDTEKQRLRIMIAKRTRSESGARDRSAAIQALKALKKQPIVGTRVFVTENGEPLERRRVTGGTLAQGSRRSGLCGLSLARLAAFMRFFLGAERCNASRDWIGSRAQVAERDAAGTLTSCKAPR